MTKIPETSAAPKSAQAQIAPLNAIGIAPENLRASEPADADIAALANTIEAAGLLYPLLVRPGRKGEPPFMALDGRRRLLALQSLADDARIAADFDVKVEVARDKALQAAAIVVSNTQRAPVHVADVIVAIGKLKSLKMTPAKIASALGYAEIEVKRLQCLLDRDSAAKLKVALGLTDLATSLGGPADVERRVLAGAELRLAGGLFLRKVRYMDRPRIEVVNGLQERAALRLMGCVIEVANYVPRLFVPIGAEAVMQAVLARHPVEEVVERREVA